MSKSSFGQKFEDGLMVIAEKVDGNKYLGAIKDGFTTFMPFIIVGSFATLFNTLICSTKTGLAAFIPWLVNLKPAFDAINFATLSCMALPIVFLIAMELARKNKVPEYITGVIALASFVIVVPQYVEVIVNEVTGTAAGLPGAAIGAQGLFIGMFLTLIVVEIFSKLMKVEKIKIKMPPSVPGQIATSFNTLIPILITLLIVSIGGTLFHIATGSYLNQWIYAVVQAPLEAVFQSPVGAIALFMIAQVFWFLGIHGNMVITPIRNPLIASAIAANIASAAAGTIPNQPITYGSLVSFIVVGGAGVVISLLFAIFIFSKRDDHRMIAKLGVGPALFGISEPVVYGLPLVLNMTFAIPFILAAGVATGSVLFFTSIGFLPCNIVDVPFGFPIIINAFIGHGWQGVVVQLFILVACTALYAPFVLLSNKQYAKEQAELKAQQALEAKENGVQEA
ncbi:PTS sugar transporter subunit IIC [Anaerorhabdus sp.]|uniref:PTS sugar transporter subunit IIC n=1 Tax=Anaerorhabdus sp. TaxID=1872524 RepID=UPI002FC58971